MKFKALNEENKAKCVCAHTHARTCVATALALAHLKSVCIAPRTHVHAWVPTHEKTHKVMCMSSRRHVRAWALTTTSHFIFRIHQRTRVHVPVQYFEASRNSFKAERISLLLSWILTYLVVTTHGRYLEVFVPPMA